MRARLCAWVAATVFLGLCSAAPVAAADDPIEQAVKKGSKFLKDLHAPRDGYNGGTHGVGTACLAGLALLEAGLPEDDPSLKNIIKYVHANAMLQSSTYEVALAVMFLDRLGRKTDVTLIQYLGARLMVGQTRSGGWSYQCGTPLDQQELGHLKAVIGRDAKLVAQKNPKLPVKQRDDLPAVANPPAPKPEGDKKEPAKEEDGKPAFNPEIARWLKLQNVKGGNANPEAGLGLIDGDNSNTQFAILGLWVARRHGLPCDKALELSGKRFRSTQTAEGGWEYMPRIPDTTATMTCAGLIGLAVAMGTNQNVLKNKKANAKNEAAPNNDPLDDAAVKNGLKLLGRFIANGGGMPGIRKGPRGVFGRGRRVEDNSKLSDNLYLLWSIERTAVIFSLETIGNIDWYNWGADSLLETQEVDGSWTGAGYHGANAEVGTSFALLFLCRANIAKDLSAALKGKVKDPGVAVLRGGGNLPGFPERKPAEPAKVDPKPDPAATVKAPPATGKGSEFETEAAKLTTALINASPDARPALLAQLRDKKGGVNTEALARAAAKLTGDAQQQTREALAKRLTRMTPATLRDMMKDENREIRRSAAAACGLKEDRQYIPDLIEVLGDAEAQVALSAHSSLKALSGKDFGPQSDASAESRQKAVAAWKSWWASQSK